MKGQAAPNYRKRKSKNNKTIKSFKKRKNIV
jgi:hypothetical protein